MVIPFNRALGNVGLMDIEMELFLERACFNQFMIRILICSLILKKGRSKITIFMHVMGGIFNIAKVPFLLSYPRFLLVLTALENGRAQDIRGQTIENWPSKAIIQNCFAGTYIRVYLVRLLSLVWFENKVCKKKKKKKIDVIKKGYS